MQNKKKIPLTSFIISKILFHKSYTILLENKFIHIILLIHFTLLLLCLDCFRGMNEKPLNLYEKKIVSLSI